MSLKEAFVVRYVRREEEGARRRRALDSKHLPNVREYPKEEPQTRQEDDGHSRQYSQLILIQPKCASAHFVYHYHQVGSSALDIPALGRIRASQCI